MITLIYYRNEHEKILRYHLPPKGMSPEQLETEMEKFNKKDGAKVYSQDIEDGSLEMYLYEKAQYKRRFPQEAIQVALDALSEARDAIECLEVENDDG